MFCGSLTGWGARDPTTQRIEGDAARFPEGMPSFIAKIHAMGFKFGLYTDIGTMGCHPPFVGSWPHYAQDAKDFASWGVDYVKFDYCDQPTGPGIGNATVLSCDMSEALARTGEDIWLNFHCDDSSEWHGPKCAACANSYRVAHDHGDWWANTADIINFLGTSRAGYWGANPSKGWPDPDFVFTGGMGCGKHSAPGVRCPGQTEDEYISEFSVWAVAGGQLVIASDPRNMTAFQRSIWFNEDVLDVFKDTSRFSEIAMVHDHSGAEAREPAGASTPSDGGAACTIELTRQLSGSPCVEGTSYGCNADGTMWVSDSCRAMFTCDGVPDIYCPGFKIPYNETTTCSCSDVPKPSLVFGRPLADGRSVAAVLHNPGPSARTVTASFAALPGGHGWGDATTLRVRDLWAGEDRGEATGKFSARVNAHGAVFLKVTAAAA